MRVSVLLLEGGGVIILERVERRHAVGGRQVSLVRECRAAGGIAPDAANAVPSRSFVQFQRVFPAKVRVAPAPRLMPRPLGALRTNVEARFLSLVTN
jgi:hypothetical protein